MERNNVFAKKGNASTNLGHPEMDYDLTNLGHREYNISLIFNTETKLGNKYSGDLVTFFISSMKHQGQTRLNLL